MRARFGLTDRLDDALGRAGRVGLLADLVSALGMDDHVDVRLLGAGLVNVLGPEEHVHGAVALPEDIGGVEQGVFIVAAEGCVVRVPDTAGGGHVRAHLRRGVSAEVLIGQEQDFDLLALG